MEKKEIFNRIEYVVACVELSRSDLTSPICRPTHICAVSQA